MSGASFDQFHDLEPGAPTLVEGLPGQGLVASIAVEQITEQLDLDAYGAIRSDEIPPAASFADGLVQETVRVYAGTDPAVLTLQSDVPIPPEAFSGLSECVLSELAAEFERAIFIAGAPAESEDERETVTGIATTEARKEELVDASIDVETDSGAVGDVTGALVSTCHRKGVPAILLLVRTHPRLPDPGAAQVVIEDAVERLVDFDIDTQPLRDRAEEIQQQKQQIVEQVQGGQGDQQEPVQSQEMFQ